jgi:type II restriction enzyme
MHKEIFMTLKGNVGEWSEVYTILKILGAGQIPAAKADLSEDPSNFFPVRRILRRQNNFEFDLVIGNLEIEVFKDKKGSPESRVARTAIIEASDLLLERMKTKSSTTFSVPAIETTLGHLGIENLFESNKNLSDIHFEVHDPILHKSSIRAFSIKSQLGQPATLLNASQKTNFLFEVSGSSTEMSFDALQHLSTREVLEKLDSNGYLINYSKLEDEPFMANLLMVDTQLPQIVAAMLLIYYSGKGKTIVELTDQITQANPLKLPVGEAGSIYTHKLKTLLVDIALGLRTSSLWSGEYSATGGYLVVTKDGSVVYLHSYNREAFRDYLYENTKLEAPSRKRHKYGSIIMSGGKTYLKLNLQIRFK